MTDGFSDVAQRIQATWAAAFSRADWVAIAALYAPETAFYGSTPVLHTDPVGVLSYFASLPPVYVAARFGTQHILPLGPDLFVASGDVVFVVKAEGGEQDRAYRLSQVFQRTPSGWRIALHHASPRPA